MRDRYLLIKYILLVKWKMRKKGKKSTQEMMLGSQEVKDLKDHLIHTTKITILRQNLFPFI